MLLKYVHHLFYSKDTIRPTMTLEFFVRHNHNQTFLLFFLLLQLHLQQLSIHLQILHNHNYKTLYFKLLPKKKNKQKCNKPVQHFKIKSLASADTLIFEGIHCFVMVSIDSKFFNGILFLKCENSVKCQNNLTLW
jgi:hypothetical protein